MNTANLMCGVCHEMLLDPRTLPCGHNYCGKTNGLGKPCIEILVRDGVLKCAMDNKRFEKLKVSDLCTNTVLRDTVEEYRNGRMNKCPDHSRNSLDMVCLTCGEMNICLSCMKNHPRHEVVSAADHAGKRLEEKSSNLRVKKENLRGKLTDEKKAIDKLTELLEKLRQDYDKKKESLEKLISLQARCQRLQDENTSDNGVRWSEVENFLKLDEPVEQRQNQIHAAAEETFREVSKLLEISENRSGASGSDASPVVSEKKRVEEEVKNPAPKLGKFNSVREVARVKGVKIESIACVDDAILACTVDACQHLVKYRWSNSGDNIAITEIKKADIKGCDDVAAASASDGVRLYVCTYSDGVRTVHRHDAETLEQRQQIDTSSLMGDALMGCLAGRVWRIAAEQRQQIDTSRLRVRDCWRIAAWSNYMAISDDRRVIALYKDDLLVRTFKYEHCVLQLELSTEFIATWTHLNYHIQVHRWGEQESELTPVHAVERDCGGMALSERLVITRDYHKNKLVLLDITTGEQRELKGDGNCWPRAFARDDLLISTHGYPGELAMVKLC